MCNSSVLSEPQEARSAPAKVGRQMRVLRLLAAHQTALARQAMVAVEARALALPVAAPVLGRPAAVLLGQALVVLVLGARAVPHGPLPAAREPAAHLGPSVSRSQLFDTIKTCFRWPFNCLLYVLCYLFICFKLVFTYINLYIY